MPCDFILWVPAREWADLRPWAVQDGAELVATKRICGSWFAKIRIHEGRRRR